jgi:hypothetical protein
MIPWQKVSDLKSSGVNLVQELVIGVAAPLLVAGAILAFVIKNGRYESYAG